MQSRSFTIRPISGALGAEIYGVDLARDRSPETMAAIRAALLDHLAIFLPGQALSSEQYLAVANGLGTPIEYPFVKGIEGFPQIIAVAKLAHQKINFGSAWHSDTTYLPEPPMATLLLARELPAFGGDTQLPISISPTKPCRRE